MLGKKKILILSPHTDDAELGAGGTISKLIADGADVKWIVFSTAEESLPKNLNKNILKLEFLEVVKNLNLNLNKIKICKFPVRKLHNYRQEILEILVEFRANFNPDLVIGPSLYDFHQDHKIIANEMVRAYKNNSSIICYELPWNHINFSTNLFVKLGSKELNKKIELLNLYNSQILKKRKYFSPDFVRGLALTRGVQCNYLYAEAFEVIRWMM